MALANVLDRDGFLLCTASQVVVRAAVNRGELAPTSGGDFQLTPSSHRLLAVNEDAVRKARRAAHLAKQRGR